MLRFLVHDETSGEQEISLLKDAIPEWVAKIVSQNIYPKHIKITFYLHPHPSCAVNKTQKT